MRSPSVLELVESASGERRAIIGDVKGVSKSSRDKGLVIGLVTFTFVASEVTAAVVGLIGLMIIELEELSMVAKELPWIWPSAQEAMSFLVAVRPSTVMPPHYSTV